MPSAVVATMKYPWPPSGSIADRRVALDNVMDLVAVWEKKQETIYQETEEVEGHCFINDSRPACQALRKLRKSSKPSSQIIGVR